VHAHGDHPQSDDDENEQRNPEQQTIDNERESAPFFSYLLALGTRLKSFRYLQQIS